jgi:hypothetical protein
MQIKKINPIARVMLRLRKAKQVIPNKKKDLPPEYDEDCYIDMETGKLMTSQKEEYD